LWPSTGICPEYRYEGIAMPLQQIIEMTAFCENFEDIPSSVLHQFWKDIVPGSTECELLQYIYNENIHASWLLLEFKLKNILLFVQLH